MGSPAWGWLQVMCLHGGDSRRGPGWAGGTVEGGKGISLSSVPCYSLPHPQSPSHRG